MKTRRPGYTLLLKCLFVLCMGGSAVSIQAAPSASEGRIAIGSADNIAGWHLVNSSPALQETDPSAWTTPLGSVWKLFVYSYLHAQKTAPGNYVCSAKPSLKKEELYCCDPGETIDQDEALVLSCGLYFQPERLSIQASHWQAFWKDRGAPLWLQNLATATNEHSSVRVVELLDALAIIPTETRDHAAQILLLDWTSGKLQSALPLAGTALRIKTFTMPDKGKKGSRIGGGAGWLADGTPVWLSSSGGSPQAIFRLAAYIQPLLADHFSTNDACITVRFFARYPVTRVEDMRGKPVNPGTLNGRYRVFFAKGTQAVIESKGEVVLQKNTQSESPGFTLTGKMGMNEYIARVIDREAAAEPREAARALAVVIRTYAYQETEKRSGACRFIEDSSQKQRVSPLPPSNKALRIARETDSLVLAGDAVFYHQSQGAIQRLSWKQAVRDAQAGQRFVRILAAAYPKSSLTVQGHQEKTACKPLPKIQKWLEHAKTGWHQKLITEPGFEIPGVTPTVCLLEKGKPYSDHKLNRIYVRQAYDEQTGVTLAHEYLHFVFAHHPNGQNEHYIEQQANRLAIGVSRR